MRLTEDLISRVFREMEDAGPVPGVPHMEDEDYANALQEWEMYEMEHNRDLKDMNDEEIFEIVKIIISTCNQKINQSI